MHKQIKVRYLATFFMLLLVGACSTPEQGFLTIEIDYLGDASLRLQKKPLHYKYSAKEDIKALSKSSENEFSYILDRPVEGEISWVTITIEDKSFPLAIQDDRSIYVQIQRSSFPTELRIMDEEGNPLPEYQGFLEYQKEVSVIDQAISRAESEFTQGEWRTMLALSKEKVALAERLLRDGLYHSWFLRTQGEHLVRELRALEFGQR